MSVEVAEGISGVWFYHLVDPEKSRAVSLCGRPVMRSAVPLSAWGHRSHLNEGWCTECAKSLPGASPDRSPSGAAVTRGSKRAGRRPA